VPALLILAGCGDGARDDAGRTIACGVEGHAPDQLCGLEVAADAHGKGTLRLVLRRPDGGFQRLLWPKNGTLMTADGAKPLVAERLAGGGVGVRVDGWFYRLEKQGGGLP